MRKALRRKLTGSASHNYAIAFASVVEDGDMYEEMTRNEWNPNPSIPSTRNTE